MLRTVPEEEAGQSGTTDLAARCSSRAFFFSPFFSFLAETFM